MGISLFEGLETPSRSIALVPTPLYHVRFIILSFYVDDERRLDLKSINICESDLSDCSKPCAVAPKTSIARNYRAQLPSFAVF